MPDYDRQALGLLKRFQKQLGGMIECMEDGEEYVPTAIGARGVLNLGLLFQARDALVLARDLD